MSARASHSVQIVVESVETRRILDELSDPRLRSAVVTFARAALAIDSANWPLSSHGDSGGGRSKPGSRPPGRTFCPDAVNRICRLAAMADEKRSEVMSRDFGSAHADDYSGAMEAARRSVDTHGDTPDALLARKGRRGPSTAHLAGKLSGALSRDVK